MDGTHVFCIFMQCREHAPVQNLVAAQCFFCCKKASKNHFFDKRKTRLRHLLDAIMLLTFFDAVVIAIATCSYRDSNMMLST